MIKGAPESHYYVLLLKSCLLGSVGEEFGNLLLLLVKHIENMQSACTELLHSVTHSVDISGCDNT